MFANTEIAKHAVAPLPAILGLDQKPPEQQSRNLFFFESPIISQRLSILENMVGGPSLVIMVIGERGCGKTTLMNEFIAKTSGTWQACRIKIRCRRPGAGKIWHRLMNRTVYHSKKNSPPSIIIDEAHQLSPWELKWLLRWASPKKGHRKIQSIVLVAEPQIRERFAEISRWLQPKSVIDKIYMSPLTRKQTGDYLKHRLITAGLIGEPPFTEDQVSKIYEVSEGLPGRINGEAFMLLEKMGRDHCGFKRSAFTKLIKWQSAVRWHLYRLVDDHILGKNFSFHLKW
jgi:type II secretory pathway predicted ATPase ExeA